jgi:hypothetical protein
MVRFQRESEVNTAHVGSYSLLFYESPSGYQTNRAQIQLSGTDGRPVARSGAAPNTFATDRHLVSAKTHRLLRIQAFLGWQQAVTLAA